MRSLLMVLVIAALLAPAAWGVESPAAVDKEEKPIRAIDIKDLKLPQVEGQIGNPKVITSEEELAKAVADKESREKIAKQVDFKTQKVIYFAWSGSGGDKLSFAMKGEKQPEVIFTYTAGLTRDLRPHFHLFVVPKDATWKLEK